MRDGAPRRLCRGLSDTGRRAARRHAQHLHAGRLAPMNLPMRPTMRATRAALLVSCLLPCCGVADTTLTYRGEGGCAGDFERMQMKDAWLRMDTRQDADSSMIYDGSE